MFACYALTKSLYLQNLIVLRGLLNFNWSMEVLAIKVISGMAEQSGE